jgi:hypothetical protein
MVQCLFWYIGNNSVRQWLSVFDLGNFKLLQNYYENKTPICLHNFLQNSFQNYFKLLFFIFFYNLNLFESNSLLTVWYALRPSQQPTAASSNYSQSININIGPSDGGTIVPLTHRPTVTYWRFRIFGRTNSLTKFSADRSLDKSDTMQGF